MILRLRAWEIESHVSVPLRSVIPCGREHEFQYTRCFAGFLYSLVIGSPSETTGTLSEFHLSGRESQFQFAGDANLRFNLPRRVSQFQFTGDANLRN